MTHEYAPLPAVRQVMAEPVTSIDPDLRINVALEVMRSNDIRRLPVVSKTGRLIGIVTLDQAQLAKAENSGLGEELPFVRDVMTDYVYTIGPEETLDEAAKLMVSHDISSLPVMDGDKMIGIVTESDLFKFLAGWLSDE